MRKFFTSTKEAGRQIYETVSASCTIAAVMAVMAKMQGTNDRVVIEAFAAVFLLGIVGGPILWLLCYLWSPLTKKTHSR